MPSRRIFSLILLVLLLVIGLLSATFPSHSQTPDPTLQAMIDFLFTQTADAQHQATLANMSELEATQTAIFEAALQVQFDAAVQATNAAIGAQNQALRLEISHLNVSFLAGQELALADGHNLEMRVSPNGKYLALYDGGFGASGASRIRVFDYDSLMPISEITLGERVMEVIFHPVDNVLYTYHYEGGAIGAYDVQTGALLGQFFPPVDGAFQPFIKFMALNGVGDVLAGMTSFGHLVLWNTQSFQPIQTFEIFNGTLLDMAFYGDNLIAVDDAGTVKVWNVYDRRFVGEYPSGATSAYSLELHPYLPRIAIRGHASWQYGVWVWDYETRSTLYDIETPGMVYVTRFSPDGAYLAVAGDTAPLSLYDVNNGTLITTYANAFANDAAFCVDMSCVAVALFDIPEIRFYKPLSGEVMQSVFEHSDEIYTLIMGRDGKLMFSASGDHSVRAWAAMGE